ncbi:hypothetical protein FNF27_06668 [Cafeteria roenbergensis]|uniref:Uncharacterized protein n=1 Tax=Cafeteria roenbergensis TaxID=33653 RepID=A0A5A8DXI5_CAFRO|nr:hypothetical protein FNF29_07364 [Cafeteria roenbergensis]KAA0158082.1 hypothetical protein FNF31_05585 [Cafeteria roenbergensis]KAA0163332.1 hypothetical protein FNF28_04252 [Cafeteria roenbergensis]KAA0170235.1 hypothetical protein FNF27_06668 [Cafeteria roenbergensis]|eukprot:KAA0147419.1 hypothetical protein FNF29_07364 [Cafeteria roenbergensis]
MPLGRVLAYSGLGLLGVTAFFPVAVFKVSLGIAGLMVGRNVMARLAGWPESKRAFFSRVMMLSVRRIMQGAMRRQSIQTFLAGSAAQITQEGLLRSMKDVAALGAGIPVGINPAMMVMRSLEVVDNKLVITLECPLRMREASDQDDTTDDADRDLRSMGVARVEGVIYDAAVAAKDIRPVSVKELYVALKMDNKAAAVKSILVSAWEAFIGAGHSPEENTGEGLVDRMRRMHQQSQGVQAQPEVLRSRKGRSGARDGDGDGGDDDSASARKEADVKTFTEMMRDALPLLEFDPVSAELLVRKPGVDTPEAFKLAVPEKPVSFKRFVQTNAQANGGESDSLVMAMSEILEEKQAAVDEATGARVHWPDGDASSAASRPKQRGGGRVIDASFEERS